MVDTNVLCPTLYQAIDAAHLGAIHVSNRGMAIHWGGISYQNGRRHRSILFWGETYAICCPFCGDRRFRLNINHWYGQPNPLNNNWPMTSLVRCFNETDCLSNPNNRQRLADRLVGFKNVNARTTWEVLPGIVERENIGQVQPPGQCLHLKDYPLTHPAVQYLVNERRYPYEILSAYRLGLCLEPNLNLKVYRWLHGRIIIPIYFRGEPVGWQARYVGTPPSRDIPKYITMPGMAKSRILYNFDNAVHQPYVVLVEGVGDVWSVGPQAVAVLGSKPTLWQYLLLADHFRGKPVVVLFDGDARANTEETVFNLLASNNHPAVVPVYLPAGTDPGNYDTVAINNMIRVAAAAAGASLA